jgi:Tfp pilus assembly protein FimT
MGAAGLPKELECSMDLNRAQTASHFIGRIIMRAKFRSSFSSLRQRGQGMTEYIIIVALIAIAAIGSFMYFGNTARQQIAGMATELSGQDGGAQRAAAQAQAAQATAQANKQSGLGQYGGNNQQ